MSSIILWVVCLATLMFAFVLLFGAPYLPSKSKSIKDILKKIQAQPGQKLIDLGSGDGLVLKVASRHKLSAIGFELNPLLVVFSKLRLAKVNSVKVIFKNYWTERLPSDTDIIYVFLHPRFMQRLDEKIVSDIPSKPVTLVSFAFQIPNKKPDLVYQGYYVYTYNIAKAKEWK